MGLLLLKPNDTIAAGDIVVAGARQAGIDSASAAIEDAGLAYHWGTLGGDDLNAIGGAPVFARSRRVAVFKALHDSAAIDWYKAVYVHWGWSAQVASANPDAIGFFRVTGGSALLIDRSIELKQSIEEARASWIEAMSELAKKAARDKARESALKWAPWVGAGLLLVALGVALYSMEG